jgi:hypothetical protein
MLMLNRGLKVGVIGGDGEVMTCSDVSFIEYVVPT